MESTKVIFDLGKQYQVQIDFAGEPDDIKYPLNFFSYLPLLLISRHVRGFFLFNYLEQSDLRKSLGNLQSAVTPFLSNSL